MNAIPLSEKAIIIDPRDNIAVAKVSIGLGTVLRMNGTQLSIAQTVPPGHKIALKPIAKGEPIIRYGEVIGAATQDIPQGGTVHVHNMSIENLTRQYESCVATLPVEFFASANVPQFEGYVRPWGGVGTRNYVAVLSTVICSSHPANLIGRHFENQFKDDPNFDGVISITHQEGCGGEKGEDMEQLMRIYHGIMYHPNVAGILVLGLGCEESNIECVQGCSSSLPLQLQSNTKDRIRYLTVQGAGGTSKTVSQGIEIVKELTAKARQHQRSKVSASELLLGLNCGGSDAYSGISANPALGHASDLLVKCGGTTVLPETPEIYGAEHLIMRGAGSPKAAADLLHIIERYKRYVGAMGGKLDDNPAPGNKAGGITNIVEKSLGAVRKAGSTPLNAVVNYAEPVKSRGFVIMDSPGYDTPSVSGLVSGGCNLVCFTTGRGTPTGNPIVPVIKISSNSRLYQHMQENLDVNAGTIIDGVETIDQVGEKIFKKMLAVASGEKAKNEITGHREFAIWRTGPML
ncbi:MAG: altronate dehydratase family protein [Terriglobia bacterium]